MLGPQSTTVATSLLDWHTLVRLPFVPQANWRIVVSQQSPQMALQDPLGPLMFFQAIKWL